MSTATRSDFAQAAFRCPSFRCPFVRSMVHCWTKSKSLYLSFAIAGTMSKRCHLPNLLRSEAIPACESLYATVRSISMSTVMQETLMFVVSEDITREEFKTRSQEGLVIETSRRHLDYGNYCYGMLYHLCMFYACRHSPVINSLYSQAKERYPTLDMEHQYNHHSLSMQGDVIEVALAIARETGPAIIAAARYERNTFMQTMRNFPGDLNKVLHWIDDEHDSGVYLKVSLRPPPYVLTRAVLLAVPSVRVDNEECRNQYIRRFMQIANHPSWQTPGITDW